MLKSNTVDKKVLLIVHMVKCGQDTFCAGFKDKILSPTKTLSSIRAIEADGGVHHGTYHRSEGFFSYQFKFSHLKVTHQFYISHFGIYFAASLRADLSSPPPPFPGSSYSYSSLALPSMLSGSNPFNSFFSSSHFHDFFSAFFV